MLESEKRELINKITDYGNLKSSLGKAEQLKYKNEMTEQAIREMTYEKDMLLSN